MNVKKKQTPLRLVHVIKISSPARNCAKKVVYCQYIRKLVQLCIPYRVAYHVQLEEIAEMIQSLFRVCKQVTSYDFTYTSLSRLKKGARELPTILLSCEQKDRTN